MFSYCQNVVCVLHEKGQMGLKTVLKVEVPCFFYFLSEVCMAFSMRIGVYSRYIWAQRGLLSKASGVLCDLAGRLRPPCAAPRGPPLAARGCAGTPSG